MPGKRPKGWNVSGPCWEDVWAWARDLREEYGYWVTVTVTPPLPSLEKRIAYNVVVVAKLNSSDSQNHHITKHLAVGLAAHTPPEAVALQLVSAIYQDVDRRRYEAERAAGQGTLPL